MRATIPSEAIILTMGRICLTKAIIMAKGYVMASVLPLRGFLFLLPNNSFYVLIMHYYACIDKKRILQ